MTSSARASSRRPPCSWTASPPRTVKLVDDKTIELKAPPARPASMVDVIVRHPDGKEAVQKRAFLDDPRYR